MPTNKTSLGLNQWDATDLIKREDFNQDNEVLNELLAGKVNMPAVIPAGTDFNNYKTPGMYHCVSAEIASTILNRPPVDFTTGFALFVEASATVYQTYKGYVTAPSGGYKPVTWQRRYGRLSITLGPPCHSRATNKARASPYKPCADSTSWS